MEALLNFLPFALEGQWRGAAAVALVATGALLLIGTIYILLVAVYGWMQAYLVTMIALMSFSIILAAVWLVGIPGTIPGTGPRGTEPAWVPFLADSEQGQEFAEHLKGFPTGATASNGWRLPDPAEKYPGNINSSGEVDNIKSVLQVGLAGYFQRQKSGSAKPEDYNFFPAHQEPKTEEEVTIVKKYKTARIFFKPNGTVQKINPSTEKVTDTFAISNAPDQLLFGIEYQAVDGKHPPIRVFAYRNKGQVFMAALQWMVASILLFALHLWWLARLEKRMKIREEQLAAGGLRQPAPV